VDKFKLEYEMKRRGISQDHLCDAVGMSRSAFYRKCNGISDFTLSEINKICNYLNISPIGIFFTEEVSETTH
jgi:transcriptional regulator with XRE-family HTH domain